MNVYSPAEQRITGPLRRALAPFDRVHEREFLPAALEVTESPPSPVGRLMTWLIVGFFAVALAWATLGKVDVLATAPGRIRPIGDVKMIQPLDPGIVRAIRAQDGQRVSAGDLLIELDPTQTIADRDRDRLDLIRARLDVARLTALYGGVASGHVARPLVAPAGAPPIEVERARAATAAQAADLAAQVGDLDGQIGVKRAEAAQATAESEKLAASLPLTRQRELIRRQVTERGYGNKLQLIDAQQQLSDATHDVGVLRQRGVQMGAATVALERQRDDLIARFASNVLEELAKARGRVNQLEQDLVKTDQRTRQTALRAPVAGVVEGLSIHSIGGVVTPAQRLMTIVPDTRAITVEVRLANRDIGFVHGGQPVKVKVETFAFTRYGLVDGKVLGVSRDALQASECQGEARTEAGDETPGPPAYSARIALEQTSMTVDGERRPLLPGMAVTAEIRIGRRSVLDYLLSPLARRSAESLHER